MKWQTVILACATVLLLSACESEKLEVLKSPCAGIDGSPCGPKRPVNGALNPVLTNQQPQAS